MNEILIYGLIGVAILAVIGLGIKISLSIKGNKSSKTVIKNVEAGGDVVGRDKNHK